MLLFWCAERQDQCPVDGKLILYIPPLGLHRCLLVRLHYDTRDGWRIAYAPRPGMLRDEGRETPYRIETGEMKGPGPFARLGATRMKCVRMERASEVYGV